LKGVFKGGKAYTVQLAAFSNLGNAARSLNDWLGKGYEAYVCEIQDVGSRTRYAVRTGVFSQRRQATVLLQSLARKENIKAVLVPAVLDHSGRLAVVDVATIQ
jgi:cell division septation protein DedD